MHLQRSASAVNPGIDSAELHEDLQIITLLTPGSGQDLKESRLDLCVVYVLKGLLFLEYLTTYQRIGRKRRKITTS